MLKWRGSESEAEEKATPREEGKPIPRPRYADIVEEGRLVVKGLAFTAYIAETEAGKWLVICSAAFVNGKALLDKPSAEELRAMLDLAIAELK